MTAWIVAAVAALIIFALVLRIRRLQSQVERLEWLRTMEVPEGMRLGDIRRFGILPDDGIDHAEDLGPFLANAKGSFSYDQDAN